MTSPVADEAGRLLAAVQSWLGEDRHGSHLDGTGPECQVCPLCQLVRLVRATRPEVVEHLADASVALLAAVRAALDSPDPGAAERRSSRVEHIDIGE